MGFFETLVCYLLGLLAFLLKSLFLAATPRLRFIGLLCSEQNNLRLSNKFLVKPPRNLTAYDQPALLGEF